VSPPFDLGWGLSTSADRLRCSRTKTGSGFASKAVAETLALASSVLVRQYVSDPLASDRIDGTVRGVVRCMESASAANLRSQLLIRALAPDGVTSRGTLLALDTDALGSEWATGLTARTFPKGASAGVALTPVQVEAGDHLVIEVGYHSHNTSTTSRTGTMEFGDPAASSDLAFGQTSTAQSAPWVEFSQDIEWLYAPGSVWIAPGTEVSWSPDPTTGVISAYTVNNTSGRDVEVACADASGTERLTAASGWSGNKSRSRSTRPDRAWVS